MAIVGTRAASHAGKELARTIARELGQAGCCIISGLALGIDAAAHRGALEVPSPTVGVLGGGHRRFFPLRNRELAEQILQRGGAICSPFAPDEDAYPSRFLERNGVVAALSDAVVVIEAPQRSGALNTAGWAAGRIPVLVFPGDVDRRNVAGCLALIRDGATLVRNTQDILSELRYQFASTSQIPLAQLAPPDAPLHAAILDALSREELTPDQLVDMVASTPAAILCALTELEIESRIQRREGGTFAPLLSP
ncbi:MAG: DNA-protecting protein DprA [Candidatus Eremiobacteraeota bacterium]|nr:DNA-protecting protein DprA [Candidatus Eremiobacteraeota bacterium]